MKQIVSINLTLSNIMQELEFSAIWHPYSLGLQFIYTEHHCCKYEQLYALIGHNYIIYDQKLATCCNLLTRQTSSKRNNTI